MAQHVDHSRQGYSSDRLTAWLQRIRLPKSYLEYIDKPAAIPKTIESLRTLLRCQITTFPYENLTVHYCPTRNVNIDPDYLYQKLMGRPGHLRGGYCLELSIFFYHMLRALGFDIYMTGVRIRPRADGKPHGQYLGWTHIMNIVQLPDGSRFSLDVGFGGDGPTEPLPLDDAGTVFSNIGTQQIRLVHDHIPKQRLSGAKSWIYEYRNSADQPWNPFYCFTDIEFFQEDFEVMNWWAIGKGLHRWTVLVVRFLRKGEPVRLLHEGFSHATEAAEIEIVGKVMLVNTVIKVNLGGKTQIVHEFNSEEGRRQALADYFGITLSDEHSRVALNPEVALQ